LATTPITRASSKPSPAVATASSRRSKKSRTSRSPARRPHLTCRSKHSQLSRRRRAPGSRGARSR
jgi:hypothetical protein